MMLGRHYIRRHRKKEAWLAGKWAACFLLFDVLELLLNALCTCVAVLQVGVL